MKKIVLASASPRRRELLSQVGVAFEVKPASGEERITSAEPAKVVEELSRQKAMFTAYALEEEENRDLRDVVVIGADTVVSYEGKILGKPADETAAIEMLAMLQGNTHQVYTGVTLLIREKGRWKAHTFSISIQSDTAWRAVALPFTLPARLMAPPYSRNFSVNVVLPASG